MFAQDRDLIVLEPSLFSRVAWTAQRLVSGTGALAAGALTLTAQDNSFEAAGVDAGHVVLVDGAALEVTQRLTATSVRVSRLRTLSSDAAVSPANVASAGVAVFTFAPQIGDVHRRVLRMLGIEPDGAGEVNAVTESAILNSGDLTRLEALGALHLIYSGAAASTAGDSAEWQKAEWYRQRFDDERRRVVARVDTDGDGVANTVRRPGVGRFVRG